MEIKQDRPKQTIYQLEKLIERCLNESERAGDLAVANPTAKVKHRILINEDNVIRHISMTIIGELHELEIIRKMGPMFRQFRSVERDFFFLEDQQKGFEGLQALKIPDPGLPPDENE